SRNLPSPLPPEISICLFRVLQEALQNASKHSRVSEFEVELWGESNEIHLTVIDQGVGFDLSAAVQGVGLGLTSMEERLRLVDGGLSIISQSGHGTSVHAVVPSRANSDSKMAAG